MWKKRDAVRNTDALNGSKMETTKFVFETCFIIAGIYISKWRCCNIIDYFMEQEIQEYWGKIPEDRSLDSVHLQGGSVQYKRRWSGISVHRWFQAAWRDSPLDLYGMQADCQHKAL